MLVQVVNCEYCYLLASVYDNIGLTMDYGMIMDYDATI